MPRPNLENVRRAVKEGNSPPTKTDGVTADAPQADTAETQAATAVPPRRRSRSSRAAPRSPRAAPQPSPATPQPSSTTPEPSHVAPQPPRTAPQPPRATARQPARTPAPLPRRYVLLALFVILLLAGFVVAYLINGLRGDAPAPAPPPRAGYVNAARLNLREGPGTDYPVRVILIENTQVTYLNESREVGGSTWVKVQVGAQDGWVDQKYLK